MRDRRLTLEIRRSLGSALVAVILVSAINSFVPLAFSEDKQPASALKTKASGEKTFYSDYRAGNSQVTVFSESTLEDFTCVCNKVAGQCAVDPQRVESFKGRFSIRVADLETGLDLRDQHMVGPDWLDSARYPEITVQVDHVEEIKSSGPTSASLVLVGTCNLHGKTQDVRIPAVLTYLDETPETMRRVKGDLIRIRAEFNVKLADYGLTGPPGSDWIGLKVAEVVKIKVTVFGSTERPADPLKVDRPDAAAKSASPPPARPKSPSSGP